MTICTLHNIHNLQDNRGNQNQLNEISFNAWNWLHHKLWCKNCIKSIYLYDIENLTMQCDNVKPHMLYMWHHTSTILHGYGGPPGEWRCGGHNGDQPVAGTMGTSWGPWSQLCQIIYYDHNTPASHIIFVNSIHYWRLLLQFENGDRKKVVLMVRSWALDDTTFWTSINLLLSTVLKKVFSWTSSTRPGLSVSWTMWLWLSLFFWFLPSPTLCMVAVAAAVWNVAHFSSLSMHCPHHHCCPQ